MLLCEWILHVELKEVLSHVSASCKVKTDTYSGAGKQENGQNIN